MHLGAFPLVVFCALLAVRWAWSSAAARQLALVGVSAGANADASAAGAALPAVTDIQERRRAVQLVYAAVSSKAGEQVSDLLQAAADGKPLPQPDAELCDDAGLPVLGARISDAALPLAVTRSVLEALLPRLLEERPEWKAQELAEDAVRALSALHQPLLSQFEWLQGLAKLRPDPPPTPQENEQSLPASQQTGLRVLLGLPTHWSAFEQLLAQRWFEHQLAAFEPGWSAHYVLSFSALTGTGEELWLKVDQWSQTNRRADWMLVLACHSDLSQPRIDALSAAQRLYDSTQRPGGCMPGEAAAALLLAPAGWVAPKALDLTAVQLYQPALMRRSQPVTVGGKVSHLELDEAVKRSLLLAQTQSDEVGLLVCDADQHSRRATELYGTTITELPHLDPIEDLRVLGKITGYTGVASFLSVIAGACAWVKSSGKTALALGMADSHLRAALVLKPHIGADGA